MDEKTIKYWITTSEYDLVTAKSMLKAKRYLYVGFMCHQTIEKVLKAYYVKIKNKVPPHIHNLLFLAEETGIYTHFSEKQKDLLNELRPLNIEARYPKYKDNLFKSLSAKRCEKILQETAELYKWIIKELNT
jgi:HEPN domain-containing protein